MVFHTRVMLLLSQCGENVSNTTQMSHFSSSVLQLSHHDWQPILSATAYQHAEWTSLVSLSQKRGHLWCNRDKSLRVSFLKETDLMCVSRGLSSPSRILYYRVKREQNTKSQCSTSHLTHGRLISVATDMPGCPRADSRLAEFKAWHYRQGCTCTFWDFVLFCFLQCFLFQSSVNKTSKIHSSYCFYFMFFKINF